MDETVLFLIGMVLMLVGFVSAAIPALVRAQMPLLVVGYICVAIAAFMGDVLTR